MADYINIEDYLKKGKVSIHSNVFNKAVLFAIQNLDFISTKDLVEKNEFVKLFLPIKINIDKNIVHVAMKISIHKGYDFQEVIRKIEDEVNIMFVEIFDRIPFDVNVRVESIF